MSSVNPTTRFPDQGGFAGKPPAAAHSPADGPAPRRTDRRGQYGHCADDPDDSPDRAAFASQMAGLRLRINIGNGGKASSSSLGRPAQRGEHPQDRQGDTPRSASRRPARAGTRPRPAVQRPLRGVQHQLAQPAGGQRAGREDIIGHH